jgi:hypothetical protein
LLGLATRLTDGYAAAAPRLTAALRVHRVEERPSDWSWVAYSLAAMELWGDDAWLHLASSQVELTRATGALILLPFALVYLATFHIEAGSLSLASALIEEAQSLDLRARAETLPYVPLRLAAWRGEVSTALSLVDVMIGRRPHLLALAFVPPSRCGVGRVGLRRARAERRAPSRRAAGAGRRRAG